ncbi:YceD family protein [Thermoactinomyces mirandus]|uniref:DUF177 domain-containing protein n=1 Tax=Thermoactinomyces mirandus TaxID=2756294 RepID=A0A7W1XSN4_9BACL|nr:DUF177 domain-containing protein [Thermoactinomyces mirandus]MBA4602417.1 DUF177 domain-containing protein [Thermoactinomyces mirandus]
MQISLHKLKQANDGLLLEHETIQFDLVGEVPELTDLGPVHVKARAELIDPDLFVVNAAIRAQAKFLCVKCLTEFRQVLEAALQEYFTDEPYRAVDSEEQEIHLVHENKLDLTPFVREALLLQFPSAPICRENCRGLCPVCGKNRNTDPCHCQVKSVDPRLAALENWHESDG